MAAASAAFRSLNSMCSYTHSETTNDGNVRKEPEYKHDSNAKMRHGSREEAEVWARSDRALEI